MLNTTNAPLYYLPFTKQHIYAINIAMSELRPPEQISLRDFGVTTAEQDMLNLQIWTLIHATVSLDTHSHTTSFDDRPYSIMRKTGPILNPRPTDAPPHPIIAECVGNLYRTVLEPTKEYFSADLHPMPNEYAAVGHIHAPGDGPGESHLDYYPSANLYLNDSEGDLLIAKNPDAKSIDDITRDAYRIHPIAGTIVLFDGTRRPHYVEAIPETSRYSRGSMNFTYWRDVEPSDPPHRRHVDASLVLSASAQI